ncbi:MAG: hypothetical protein LBC98_07260 [Prevotellaceae bacterium]|jgi:hypothetical protein|nr:hypothetical protein [Prevotellaceae bacterium]
MIYKHIPSITVNINDYQIGGKINTSLRHTQKNLNKKCNFFVNQKYKLNSQPHFDLKKYKNESINPRPARLFKDISTDTSHLQRPKLSLRTHQHRLLPPIFYFLIDTSRLQEQNYFLWTNTSREQVPNYFFGMNTSREQAPNYFFGTNTLREQAQNYFFGMSRRHV